MQNRYTGDIGDFSKLGILRALQDIGLTIGINWYLTPDETHNSDGRHINYLDQERFRKCDEKLWLELNNIVKSKKREVRLLERESILDATFYSRLLDFAGKAKIERQSLRREWHFEAVNTLTGNDMVFVDPDNGLIVPSAKGKPKENKYALVEELADYYASHSSVIYYQHKARKKDKFYIHQHASLISSEIFSGAIGFALKFITTSQRYYFFILQPQHQERVEMAIQSMLASSWSDHFKLIPDKEFKNQ